MTHNSPSYASASACSVQLSSVRATSSSSVRATSPRQLHISTHQRSNLLLQHGTQWHAIGQPASTTLIHLPSYMGQIRAMETIVIVGHDETVSTAEEAAAAINHAYETHLKSSGSPTTYHDHPPWGPSIAALRCHKSQEHIPQTYKSQPR